MYGHAKNVGWQNRSAGSTISRAYIVRATLAEREGWILWSLEALLDDPSGNRTQLLSLYADDSRERDRIATSLQQMIQHFTDAPVKVDIASAANSWPSNANCPDRAPGAVPFAQ